MSEFEFSTVVVSIVLAIAIARILATWGSMIRLRHRVRPYWVHAGWSALILLLAVQNWLGYWELQDWPGFSFLQYLLILLPSLILVVLTFVVCPDLATEGVESMERNFYDNSSWSFGLAAIYLVALIASGSLLQGDSWIGQKTLLRLVGLAAVSALSVTKSRKVHSGAVAGCYALFVLFVFLDTRGS